MSNKPIRSTSIEPEIREIPVEDISPNPYQGRTTPRVERMEELREEVTELLEEHDPAELDLTAEQEFVRRILAFSEQIDQEGLYQEPKVTPAKDGYELVYGERRWWAHRFLDKERIRCKVENVSEREQRLQAWRENHQRQDLNVLEKGEMVYGIFTDAGIELHPKKIANILQSIRRDRTPSVAEYAKQEFVAICDTIGEKPSKIERWLKAYSISPSFRETLRQEQELPSGSILARLSAIDDQECQQIALETIREKGYTVEKASKLITGITNYEEAGRVDEAKNKLTSDQVFSPSAFGQSISTEDQQEQPGEGPESPAEPDDENPEIDSPPYKPEPEEEPGDDEPEPEAPEQEAKPEGQLPEHDRESNPPYTRKLAKYYPDHEVWDPILVNTDARSFLTRLDAGSVDCVITDPPYGKGEEAKPGWPAAQEYAAQHRQENLDFLREQDDSQSIPALLKDTLSNDSFVLVFCGGESMFGMHDIFAEVFGQAEKVLTWNKKREGSPGDNYWRSKVEYILCFTYGEPEWKRGPRSDMLSHSKDAVTILDHQKPRALIEDLIEITSHPGDVVLDCFGGSYAVARAAMVMSRKGVSCEIEKEVHTRAIEELVDKDRMLVRLENQGLEIEETSLGHNFD